MKKTGFIAIVGRPNVGKSTLLNALLGEKVAIVSNKPQTTRTRITGILTKGENQFVFLDTPGMHNPRNRLGEYMVKTVSSAIGDVDAALLVVECGSRPTSVERNFLQRFDQLGLPVILIINKIDMGNAAKVAETITAYAAEYKDYASVIPISAAKNDGVDIVLDEVEQFLDEGDWYFDEDELTDQPERQIASEIIREKLLRSLNEEVPHGIAVVIEAFEESSRIIKIRAEIFCEKESHKGIIIGKHGETLKMIGSRAREDLERFFDAKVYLDLWVKVKVKWRDSPAYLHNFGYDEKDI